MKNNEYEFLIEQLHDKGYTDLYNSIKEADKYYEKDYKIYCGRCRIILEYFLSKIEEIVNIPQNYKNNDKNNDKNLDYRIKNLKEERVEIDNDLVTELTNMRIHGNHYMHESSYKDTIDPPKDRMTFRIAIIKITKKILELPEIYQKAEEARQRKKAEEVEREKRQQKWAVAGSILAGVLFVVGLLFGGGSKRD